MGLFDHMKANHIISMKGIKVLLIGATALSIGCSSLQGTKDLCDALLVPEVLEPGACADARAEIRAPNAEKRAQERERRGVTVITPKGYSVKLDKYNNVMYEKKTHTIYEINSPNITITPKQTDKDYVYSPRDNITIPINRLDMMQE